MYSKVCFLILSALLCLSAAASTHSPDDNSTSTETPKTPPTHTTQPSSTGSTTPSLTPEEQCMRANGSCEDCVKVGSGQCVWCDSKKQCTKKNKLLPTHECALADARWGVCWLNYDIAPDKDWRQLVNYEALIIACSVIGGVLILALVVCICCCCCCRKGNKDKWAREDAKVERQKTERKEKNAEKRAERKAKTDEIRRKYGLIKDDTPYTRFDDN